jgi:hypothetical protein
LIGSLAIFAAMGRASNNADEQTQHRQIFAKSNASWSNLLGLTLDRRRFRILISMRLRGQS